MKIVGWVRAAGLGALAVAVCLPIQVEAQAVCSAPHSSPTLAQSGSLSTVPAGAGWVQLSIYGQRSDEFFNHLGDQQPFLASSEFNTRSVFLTGAVGLIEGIELWAQVPTHHLTVDASSGGSTTTGVGDLRFAMRAGSELFGLEIPVAVRFGVKVPGSDFPVDATVLPLTEGQRDFEVSVESGSGLGSLPMYVMGWLGYRWRGANLEAARRPGAERYAHLALGGLAGRLNWEVAADGLWGEPPLAHGLRLEGDRRRLIQLLPTLGYEMGPGRLEFTGQLPLWGRNLPSGVGISLGYRTTWGL